MKHIYLGTAEYLTVTVYAPLILDTQAVAFSFDRTTWITAAWLGSAAPQRQARALINAGNTPAAGTYTLFVRVTDGSEVPIAAAGQVTIH